MYAFFSAVANALVADRFVYLNRPFMVNGASKHSNGAAAADPSISDFVKDNLASGYTYHPSFPASRSYNLNVCEALAIAYDEFASDCQLPKLSMAKILSRTFENEYLGLGRDYLKSDIINFAIRNKLPVPNLVPTSPPAAAETRQGFFFREGDWVGFESPYLCISDVFEASRFAESILAERNANPGGVWTNSLRSRVAWWVRRLLMGARKIDKHT